MVAPSGSIMSGGLAKKNGGGRSAFPMSRMWSRELRPTHQMRRTGNDLVSPATAIEGCGKAGMTKDVAFMNTSRRGKGRKLAPKLYAVALIGARVRGPASRCCIRKNEA